MFKLLDKKIITINAQNVSERYLDLCGIMPDKQTTEQAKT